MSMLTLLQIFTPAAPPAPPATYASTVVGLAWVFFALAAALSLTGLWLLWRGVFRDPDRKLRRCSKCWYVMEGVPGLRCPECGRQHKDERRLNRRRRHRWVAATGLFVLFVAFATAWTPRVANRGWLGSVPTWGLILAAWVYDTEDAVVLEAATDRVFGLSAWGPPFTPDSHAPTLWGWMLHRSVRAALMDDIPEEQSLPPEVYARVNFAADCLQGLESYKRDVIPDYVSALQHPSPAVRLVILEQIRYMSVDIEQTDEYVRDPRLVSAVTSLLNTQTQREFELAAQWLRRSPADTPPYEVIANGLRRFQFGLHELDAFGRPGTDLYNKCIADLDLSNPTVSASLAQWLMDREPTERARLKAIAALTDCPAAHGRMWCATLCGHAWPSDRAAQEALAKAAREDQSEDVRHSAMLALSGTSAPPQILVPALIAGLDDPAAAMRYFCAWRIHGRIPDIASALPRLREIAADEREEPRTRETAAKAIASIEAATAATNP